MRILIAEASSKIRATQSNFMLLFICAIANFIIHPVKAPAESALWLEL